MPIRVLFLNTRDQCGADVAVHLHLMKNFAPEDVEAFVISNSEASDADQMRQRLGAMPHVASVFLPLGRPTAALADKTVIGKVLAYGPSAASMAKAAAFIRQNRIQIIHATDRPRDASYASLLGRLSRTVSVVHMHSHVGDYHTRPTLWGMRNATAIFAISEYIRNGLGDMGVELEKVHTIYNSIDTNYFDPGKEYGRRGTIRRQFAIPEKAPLVGIAARMNPWKGQRELVGAASLLRQKYPDLHVMIIGAFDRDCHAELQNMAREGGIADRVHFGGYQQDVRPFFQEFDLFVHPSYGEPFGLSIVEAMAMRKPVIACASGGVPEIVTHTKDGWLVEERSAEAVASAITTLLENRDLSMNMGERARETVRTRFSPERQAGAVARHYAMLTSGSSVNVPNSFGADRGPRC